MMETVDVPKRSHKKSKSTPAKHLKGERDAAAAESKSKRLQVETPSSLWECYYPSEEGEGEGGRGEEVRLKNIRGFLLKKRKSPLKGWHKRYFVLNNGILNYARNLSQFLKGKKLGTVDLGVSIITFEGATRCVDIDGGHIVLHLKLKNASHFAAWRGCLTSHEMYRKARLAGAQTGAPAEGGAGGEGLRVEQIVETNQEIVAIMQRDLTAIHESLDQLSIHIQVSPPSRPLSVVSMPSAGELKPDSNGDLASGDVGGGKKKKFKRKQDKKAKDTTVASSSSSEAATLSPPLSHTSSSSSFLPPEDVPLALAAVTGDSARDEFTVVAKTIYAQFSEMYEKCQHFQKVLKKSLEEEAAIRLRQASAIANQQLLLRQAFTQSSELRDRLSQIQAIASGTEPVTPAPPPSLSLTRSATLNTPKGTVKRFDSFLSLKSTVSDQFFDALDELSFSESEEEGENTQSEEESFGEEDSDTQEVFSSLSSEILSKLNITAPTPTLSSSPLPTVEEVPITMEMARSHDVEVRLRRRALPSPQVDVGDLSLWSILRKNIGKDLSKVSMPVTLNEPLSALQRLCEELEYSALLDQAAALADPFDRMVLVAAFAVSAYSSSYHRPGKKPFNPILGETYECVREDRGFRFIAEQVSHHPPIAACHCESPLFSFWQDARIKSKFWGKSMEVFPIGTVNLTMPSHGDHYQWQKVTSCIHNVFGGERWVDQYGEMLITNLGRCTCKLTFVKASYWSAKKYEVHGDVYNSDGERVRHLFGAWNSAMFCGEPSREQCVWRAATMPLDSDKYYCFSEFALQLNELEEAMEDTLPPTDCRLRPDQRLLEEGKVQEAAAEKHRVEQLQREARAERERLGEEWQPNFFMLEEDGDGEESWVSRGNYWSIRDGAGFTSIKLPALW